MFVYISVSPGYTAAQQLHYAQQSQAAPAGPGGGGMNGSIADILEASGYRSTSDYQIG